LDESLKKKKKNLEKLHQNFLVSVFVCSLCAISLTLLTRPELPDRFRQRETAEVPSAFQPDPAMEEAARPGSAHAEHLLFTEEQDHTRRRVLYCRYQSRSCFQVSICRDKKSTVQHEPSSGSLRSKSPSGGREPRRWSSVQLPRHLPGAEDTKQRSAPSQGQQNRAGGGRPSCADKSPPAENTALPTTLTTASLSFRRANIRKIWLVYSFASNSIPPRSFLPLLQHVRNNSIYFLLSFQ